MTPVITKAPETWPLPGTRCIFRGKLMDYETAAFLMAMEAELGYTLTVVQGCYSNAVGPSAGTHGGGGVVDLLPWDFERKVKVARDLGAFAWHRPELWENGKRVWPEHIHMGIRNHPALSPEAKAQQVDFDAKPRRNGLASHLVDPDQDPGRPTPTFRYPPKAPVTPTFQAPSLNDDWANLASDVNAVVRDVRPLCMGVQEGWRVKYARRIRKADPAHPGRWRVRQKLENKSTAGVAVIWDHRRLAAVGRWRRILPRPRKVGGGWQAIGKGADTRVRGVVWQDVEFKAGVDHGNLPRRFRVASVHRPPMRNRSSWGAFDAVLGLWLKRSPLPVLLFMDSNEHNGPGTLMGELSSAYSWHGVGDGIDGAVTSLPVRGARDLPKRTSDHHPVVVTLG